MSNLDKDPEVLATFKGEAYDRLAELECGVDLLQHGESIDVATVVHDLFRSAHSLKATSNLLGFQGIEKAAKNLEDLLHQLRKQQRPLDAQTKEQLVQLLDTVGLCIDDI